MPDAIYYPTDLNIPADPGGGAPTANVVGGTDALVSDDGDTSYVGMRSQGISPPYPWFDTMTFRWQAATALPPGAVVSSFVLEGVGRLGPDDTSGTGAFSTYAAAASGGLGSLFTSSTDWTAATGVPTDVAANPTFWAPMLSEIITGGAMFTRPLVPGVPTLLAHQLWTMVRLRLTYGSTARSVVRHGVRNDGLRSTTPRRWGQQSSYQSGRGGGYV